MPDGTISLAPSSLLTATVTATETEAETVDITVRETAPGEPPAVSAYGPDGPITVTVEVVTGEEGELFETPEAEPAREVAGEGEPPPDGFAEEKTPEKAGPVLPQTNQSASDDNWDLLMAENFETDSLPPRMRPVSRRGLARPLLGRRRPSPLPG